MKKTNPNNKKIYQYIPVGNAGKLAASILGVGVIFASVTQHLAAKPLGVDVSSYQGGGINWTSVKGAGFTFAWAKATEGTYDNDADFHVNINNGKAAGVIMGAYHFARPDQDSPGTEATYFWNDAGSSIAADGKTLMPMLDMETWNGVVGASSYTAWADAWCSDVVSDASGQSVTIKPFIYVSACAACNFNSGINKYYSDIASYNGENSQTGTPWNTCTSCEEWGSGVWSAWQYSDSGSVSGISGGCDVDVINATSLSVFTADGTSSGKVVASSTDAMKLRGDFNGDGLDDYVFFRPGDGTWHVTFSSDNSEHYFQFGQSGDIPLLSGDFDGDGIADAVLFRPSTHEWYVRFSTNPSVSHSFNYGQTGDIPLLGGDFDHDGQPDAVLFRPSTAEWYVRFSSDQSVHSFGFGEANDIPMLGYDYDGDGMPDAVLFRPSTAMWYVRFSSDGSVHDFSFGRTGDIPMLGQVDGGQPDSMLYRPSTGEWYVRFSSDGSVHNFGFGDNGDIPWTGYFTSDGLMDYVLYRPSNGTFYVRDSGTGAITSSPAFGTSTDIPVP